jgi:hypothetical protein
MKEQEKQKKFVMGYLHNLSLLCHIVSMVKLGWFGGWGKEEMQKTDAVKLFRKNLLWKLRWKDNGKLDLKETDRGDVTCHTDREFPCG